MLKATTLFFKRGAATDYYDAGHSDMSVLATAACLVGWLGIRIFSNCGP